MYQPDAISSYTVDGKTYIVTANEGDARDYDGYSEEDRVKDLDLNPIYFPNFENLQEDENLGRLKTTYANGDIDEDGLNEYIFSYGARSFSIWDEFGNLVFDSGDDFEQILTEDYLDTFNSNNDDNDSQESRSDDKGVEPEAIEIAQIGTEIYTFIGLERMGGIMVYNVTDPYKPGFVTYTNNRNFDVDADLPEAGDLGVENIVFVNAEDSPNGENLMITANEVSGTVSMFTVSENGNTFGSGGPLFSMANPNNTPNASACPSPFEDQFDLSFSTGTGAVTVNVYDQLGRMVTNVYQAKGVEGQQTITVNLESSKLPQGIYMVSIFEEGQATETISVVKK